MKRIVKPNPEHVDAENPEWTDEMFAQAKRTHEIPALQAALKVGRGRPKTENPKQAISIRLSPENLAYFRATGKGWQTRIDDALSEYIKSH